MGRAARGELRLRVAELVTAPPGAADRFAFVQKQTGPWPLFLESGTSLYLRQSLPAVKGVFTVVLYRYASTGVLPTGFSAREIDSTFGERKRDPWDISV